MLERAQFSLSRAGVMAGLCVLVFLSAGLLSKSPEERQNFSSTHFNERNFQRAQTVLRYISPADQAPSKYSAANRQRCDGHSSGSPQWSRSLDLLGVQLKQLHEEQFLRQPYILDIDGLLADKQTVDLSCKEILASVQWLTRQGQYQGSQFWYGLAWRERSVKASAEIFQKNIWVALPKSIVTSRSPWSGLSGCIFWRDALTGKPLYLGSTQNPVTAFCLQQAKQQNNGLEPQALTSAIELPSLPLITQSLAPWRQPQHSKHAQFIDKPHVAQVRAEDVAVGLHAQLTLDPRWQNALQDLTACYTNASGQPCEQVITKGESRFENARVRKAGLVVLDVPTGAILAAVSSDSPCGLHDAQRKGLRPSGCPSVPAESVYRPKWPKEVDNHALFTQAQPGSLVKPLLMAGILSSGANYPGLESALQRSDSQQFLDAWLCRKQLRAGKFTPDCDRPERTQAIAQAWGWSHHCEKKSSASESLLCGQRDILTGLDMDVSMYTQPLLPVLSGHTLVTAQTSGDKKNSYAEMQWPANMPTAEERLHCAESGKTGYTRCKGANLGLISEGYGQGNTLTTPVGMAGLLASLANSADAKPMQRPHILAKVFRNDTPLPLVSENKMEGTQSSSARLVKPEIAQKIISAMMLTHRKTGTAFAACSDVWDAKSCQSDLGIAGKTGTPGDADDRSLKQLQEDMKDRQACFFRKESGCDVRYPMPRPRYRWYGALFKQASSDKFDKVVVVLVQSNWRKSDGRFSDDQNAATEIGLRAIKLLRSNEKK